MKKILLLLLLGLVSCSKDEYTPVERGNINYPSFDTSKMIGAWVYETMTFNGETFLYPHNPNCTKDVFGFFNTEGRRFLYDEIIHVNDECSVSQTNLEWKVNGDKLIFYFGEQLVLIYTVISIDDDYFIVRRIADFNNDGIEDTLEIKAKREDPFGWFN